MKNFLKKKDNIAEDSPQSEKFGGLGKSSQNFLSKFKKKAKSGSDEAKTRLRGSNHTPPSADPYAPPSVNNQISSSGGVNTSTWYDIHGRIGRVQFLAFNMIWSLFVGLLGVLAGFLAGGLSSISTGAVGIVPLVLLLALIPVLAFSYFILPKRRLNDLGHTGWFSLIIFVPLVNFAYILYLIFAKGQEGTNQYGEPPAPYTKLQMILASIYPIFLIAGIALYIVSIFMAPDIDSLDMDTLPTDTVVQSDETNPITTDGSETEGEVTLTETDDAVFNPDSESTNVDTPDTQSSNTNIDDSTTDVDNTQDDASAQLDAALSKVPEISLQEFEELSSRPLFRDTSPPSKSSEDAQ